MKTPYHAALTIQQRTVDQIKVEISVAIDTADRLHRRATEVQAAIHAEHRVAAADWRLPENRYFLRMRDERARLAADRAAADRQLDQLRARAREAYGSLKAVESAADQFAANVRKAAAAAEQAEDDDRAAAGLLRIARARRVARQRRP
jgi:hypothetical protein